MKKKSVVSKKATYKKEENPSTSIVSEPYTAYVKSIRVIPSLKDFTYSEFKKISDKIPFTQAEWAAMLHVSERTLQRYAKSNGSFAPINAERAMQIDTVIKRGKEVFGSVDIFYNWLKRKPYMLEGKLSFESLTTAHGINMVLIQLGRIEHGIFA
jgi:putative toxin-antitoxin system antitoxin component (TIGR02293 family)